jgi:hypothetical protein
LEFSEKSAGISKDFPADLELSEKSAGIHGEFPADFVFIFN